MGVGVYVFIGFVLAFLILMIVIYNSLIYKKNQIENIKGSIDALLKKRYDLIPNLVSAAKVYMDYESKLLREIVNLRSALYGEKSIEDRLKASDKLSKLIEKLFVNFENYPDLKANNSILQLQLELSDIEEQISAARRAYNQVVTDFNNALEMFPSNIIANILGYKRQKVFSIPQDEKKNINIKKLFDSHES